ncbi:hypothetical protein EVAR_5142_1 [Eumeta japonica]|uniref:Uncharacterized protein n=1 Tax=Eumeta variegata TaxID=151549 RepID=A0A4C1SUE0_EUMVA|nr:hypothetical protein EVAR_5142_1 [Eumeta japonica]
MNKGAQLTTSIFIICFEGKSRTKFGSATAVKGDTLLCHMWQANARRRSQPRADRRLDIYVYMRVHRLSVDRHTRGVTLQPECLELTPALFDCCIFETTSESGSVMTWNSKDISSRPEAMCAVSAHTPGSSVTNATFRELGKTEETIDLFIISVIAFREWGRLQYKNEPARPVKYHTLAEYRPEVTVFAVVFLPVGESSSGALRISPFTRPISLHQPDRSPSILSPSIILILIALNILLPPVRLVTHAGLLWCYE